MRKITIIGAGIAGLTTAIALKQKGLEVEVFDQTPGFAESGSGINLAINAMQVFKRMGLYDDIIGEAHHITSINLMTKSLRYLNKVSLEKFEAEHKVKSVAIHRAKLHEILLRHVGSAHIHLNKRLKSVKPVPGGTKLCFEDGKIHWADIVIGADGIRSVVRQSIFANSGLRDAGQICWRGISNTKIHVKHRGELNEIWGVGKRFGFVHIGPDQIYWFGLMNKTRFLAEQPDYLDLFADYHSTVKSIIAGTTREKVLQNEILDLNPLDDWHKGNICLVGDACHATTPNLGQGAVQAIESALALSICLEQEANIQLAFERYQRIRMPKANKIVKMSWDLGKIAQLDNPRMCKLRNFLVRFTPDVVMDNLNRTLFALNY